VCALSVVMLRCMYWQSERFILQGEVQHQQLLQLSRSINTFVPRCRSTHCLRALQISYGAKQLPVKIS